MSSDYIELGPGDVIQRGDERTGYDEELDISGWFPVEASMVGCSQSEFHHKFRRPRSTLIRDAAFAVAKDARSESYSECLVDKRLIDNLLEALGEELRGEA